MIIRLKIFKRLLANSKSLYEASTDINTKAIETVFNNSCKLNRISQRKGVLQWNSVTSKNLKDDK